MFKDNTKTIQTNRLILRKFTITDADDMYNNWASDTECCKYLAWNVHKNIDETKALLESWIKAYDEGCYNWVVEIKNTHEIIGSISVMTALEKHSTCELGYCYGSKYWGNGYATEAAKAILSYSHEVLSARLCAWIEAKNKASCALAESLGMEVVKVISDQTATGWPGAYLLYAEKMQ